MNKVRKIKHSLTKNEESETAATTTTTTTNTTKAATKTKLLTPCRRVGLNRKRKNILSGSCSSSELNISSPNVSLTEIDISVKDHDDSSTPSITNKIEVDTQPPTPQVLTNPQKPRKSRLGASRKRPKTVPKTTELTPTLEELTKKYNICDVSVALTRCDFDKYIINRNTTEQPSIDISAQIENEAISSTPELQETHRESSEIQTNQISTTIEDLTPIVNNQTNDDAVEQSTPNKSAPSSAKIKDLFGDSDDSDFDFKRKKRKRFSAKPPPASNSTSNSPHLESETQKNIKTKVKKSSKKTDSQNESDEIADNTIPRIKRKRSSSHNKKSPKRSKLSTSRYNSDSDDDFMEKPRREKKDPDIKKKINIPVPDPLNRTEHIRIRENKSYTIMHMNNISSYVKYYDNDVNLKRTESDDNQQTNSQPVVSNVRTSMIIERKDYLADKGSQELDQNKPNDSQDSTALDAVSVSENQALETISTSENNTALEVVSINPDETTTDSTPDSNDTESPDSNDTLPDNIPNCSVENPKTVRYYERPDFDIPENDFETTGISTFEVANNSNFETTDNCNFETTDNSFLETTDIRSTIFETTDSSNFETTTFDVRNITTPSENIETTPEKSTSDGNPQNEVKTLLQLKNDLINEIKIKRDKLDSLKRIMAYKQEHNLDDLRKTTLQFKYTLQEALEDLLSHLKTHTERNFNMGLLLGFLKIPNEMVGYNEEKMCFE